ncbi:hypothetical protein GCM10007967_16220 [Xylanimonas ulmi]
MEHIVTHRTTQCHAVEQAAPMASSGLARPRLLRDRGRERSSSPGGTVPSPPRAGHAAKGRRPRDIPPCAWAPTARADASRRFCPSDIREDSVDATHTTCRRRTITRDPLGSSRAGDSPLPVVAG